MARIVCLMGPTASGKTALAMQWVEALPFEIISADSAMIYREMNIGTAKPTKEELTRAPHHLIDILNPDQSYSAAAFCQDVKALSEAIIQRGKIPLLTGGTMMYFHALQKGLSRLPEADPDLRNTLLERAEKEGWDRLHQELSKVDAPAALRINPGDKQRIIRALEVFHLAGKPLTQLQALEKPAWEVEFINILLFPENRAWLHQRIAERFHAMLAEGLLEETAALIKKWRLTDTHASMRTVGYRQAMACLAGNIAPENLAEKGIAATRQLAKRQLTWLRSWEKGIRWDPEKLDSEVALDWIKTKAWT